MRDMTKGHIAMLLFSLLVSGSFSLGVMVANDITPMALTALRFLLAVIFVGAMAVASGGVTRRAFHAPWRYIATGGTFAFYFVMMFHGLKTAQPVSAAAVFTLIPFMSMIIGAVFLAQHPNSRMVFALLLGAIGALWVIFRADLSLFLQLQFGRGEFLYFIGCIAHAFLPILFKVTNRGENAFMSSFGMLLGGTAVLLLFGASDVWALNWSALPARVWWVLGYLAIFASTFTFLLLQYGSMRLPGAKVMAYSYLTPTWVLFWEMGFGRGIPPLFILVGVALSFAAVLILLKD
jgi:drug/metabolite transporter (DMT)-like permease